MYFKTFTCRLTWQCTFKHSFKRDKQTHKQTNRDLPQLEEQNSDPLGGNMCPSEKSSCPQKLQEQVQQTLTFDLPARPTSRATWQSLPPSLPRCASDPVTRSAAPWSGGNRAGWRRAGRRAESPSASQWRRSRRGTAAVSRGPRPESCWSGSTCSPESSRHRCLWSGRKRWSESRWDSEVT